MFHRHKFLFIALSVLGVLVLAYILSIVIPKLHIRTRMGLSLPQLGQDT